MLFIVSKDVIFDFVMFELLSGQVSPTIGSFHQIDQILQKHTNLGTWIDLTCGV